MEDLLENNNICNIILNNTKNITLSVIVNKIWNMEKVLFTDICLDVVSEIVLQLKMTIGKFTGFKYRIFSD